MQANKPLELTDASFRAEVLESDRPVLVDFWAAWCGPCRVVSPTIEGLAESYGGAVRIGKLNIDDNPQATAAYGVRAVPTVLIFQGGEVVEELVGVQPRERYEEALRRVAA